MMNDSGPDMNQDLDTMAIEQELIHSAVEHSIIFWLRWIRITNGSWCRTDNIPTNCKLHVVMIRNVKKLVFPKSITNNTNVLEDEKQSFASMPLLYVTENYAKHTFQAPCCCFESGLAVEIFRFEKLCY